MHIPNPHRKLTNLLFSYNKPQSLMGETPPPTCTAHAWMKPIKGFERNENDISLLDSIKGRRHRRVNRWPIGHNRYGIRYRKDFLHSEMDKGTEGSSRMMIGDYVMNASLWLPATAPLTVLSRCISRLSGLGNRRTEPPLCVERHFKREGTFWYSSCSQQYYQVIIINTPLYY